MAHRLVLVNQVVYGAKFVGRVEIAKPDNIKVSKQNWRVSQGNLKNSRSKF
ncbi:MAG: hypothetical protein OXI67_15375 [Candidatus Poribacteria bacterium]|nr:hypothetical protein [Candidatus Poribacteria bacterium]